MREEAAERSEFVSEDERAHAENDAIGIDCSFALYPHEILI